MYNSSLSVVESIDRLNNKVNEVIDAINNFDVPFDVKEQLQELREQVESVKDANTNNSSLLVQVVEQMDVIAENVTSNTTMLVQVMEQQNKFADDIQDLFRRVEVLEFQEPNPEE